MGLVQAVTLAVAEHLLAHPPKLSDAESKGEEGNSGAAQQLNADDYGLGEEARNLRVSVLSFEATDACAQFDTRSRPSCSGPRRAWEQ